ncbi:hypothetical protein GCM10009838_37660 [Catenulispora subtropica]|uniref:Uncharacterized protein n=1 Tax=Catenulispora subtropica TaxID=450798 RepID=A0ABP5D7Y5_9ACTN
MSVNGKVIERKRGPRVLGEYELEGGAFGPAAGAGRGEQRDTRAAGGKGGKGQPAGSHGSPGSAGSPGSSGSHASAGSERRRRALSRSGTLWQAVLRRIHMR